MKRVKSAYKAVKSRASLKGFKIVLLSFVALTLTEVGVYCGRMVRLCIASVDPMKLSSQCVMCDRREFPLSAIDCTGIAKMNDLISNPLTVQEATCLIYNCRRVRINTILTLTSTCLHSIESAQLIKI